MSSICKSATSVGSTCKNPVETGGTCKLATAVYGINPELQVTAATDYDATSTYEGVVSPASRIYTLKNIGNGPLDWSVAANQSWVNFDVASGTLLPGEEVEVTVTINNSLLFGTNTATVTFSNDTDGVGDTTRGVELVVTGTIPLTLEGRTLASSATLVGHDEFASPSTPPKKYLVKTLSGELRICNYGTGGSCPSTLGGNNGQRSRKYEGAETYNANTGVMTTNTKQYQDNENVSCGQTPSYSLNIGFNPDTATETATLGAWLNRTITPTARVQTTNGSCAAPGLFTGSNAGKVTMCTARDDLSVEDTEDAAVARMVAAGSWGAWAAIVSQGDKKASAATRAAFTFNSTAAQYRATKTGLAPSRLFNGQVTLYRRAVGSSDPWVEVSTLTFSATTDGSGNFTYSSNNLPVVTGYEYCVFNAVLTS